MASPVRKVLFEEKEGAAAVERPASALPRVKLSNS
jgi:hypothetical protein